MNSYKQHFKKGGPKKVRANFQEEEEEFFYPAKKSQLQVKFEKFKKRYSIKE